MGASQKPRMWPVLLLLLCSGPGETSAGRSAPQVDCIVFSEDYIICDWGSKQKPMASYSFYSWFDAEDPEECKNYLQRDGIPVGCWLNFTLTNDNLFIDFHVSINSSHTNTSYSTSMLLISRVKVGAPFNLSVKTLENNQLQLHWNTTYKKGRCLEHAVQYRNNKDTSWTKQETEEMKFNVVSMDPEKRYTFYVRSKLKTTCGGADLWSDAGGPIYWGKESTPSMPLMLQVCLALASLFLLGLLVFILLHMERSGPGSRRTPRRLSSPAIGKASAGSASFFLAGAICPSAWMPGGLASHLAPFPQPTSCRGRCAVWFAAVLLTQLGGSGVSYTLRLLPLGVPVPLPWGISMSPSVGSISSQERITKDPSFSSPYLPLVHLSPAALAPKIFT